VDAAKRIRDLGAHYVVLHLGYDERNANRAMVDDNLLLKWAEAVAKENLGIPIQVVGGLTMAQAAQLPQFGITEIVISMNLGSAPVEDMLYDSITAFTVNLGDVDDRWRVSEQIRRFITGVADQQAMR
jgi:thiamine monophosphate synthase